MVSMRAAYLAAVAAVVSASWPDEGEWVEASMSSTPTPRRTLQAQELLEPRRYVSMGELRVRDGRGAALEKVWAERKTRLLSLPGFRFFTMLRRVPNGDTPYTDDVNYISCTIWDSQQSFADWRTAPRERGKGHGGGTLFGFARMVLGAMRNLKQLRNRAVLWEGLLPVWEKQVLPEHTRSGWPTPPAVAATGESHIPADAFVAMLRFRTPEGGAAHFEDVFTSNFNSNFCTSETKLPQCEGFKGHLLLRRDAADGDGVTYAIFSVWSDRASYEAWAHKQPPRFYGETIGTPELRLMNPTPAPALPPPTLPPPTLPPPHSPFPALPPPTLPSLPLRPPYPHHFTPTNP